MIERKESAVPPSGWEYGHRLREPGCDQRRCSELLSAQAREIERLSREAVKLRAAVIIRETALMWEREDRAALVQAAPGLPRRVTLARHVEALLARVQELMRERARWQRLRDGRGEGARAAAGMVSQDTFGDAGLAAEGGAAVLEASLRAADLVICQTGCLSHGAYWRVQDHCKRTGKACVMVERPQELRIVRIGKDGDGESRSGAVRVL